MGKSQSKQLPPGFEDLGALDPEELRQYKQVFERSGMSGFKNQIDKDINKWKKVPVNIAVTGNSGVGKSSFINSFRGLNASQEGAAAVDVDEMTEEPTKYVHPKNKNIALWDLPGLGTQKFPKERYLQDVQFERYDYFLIITASRFTENDLWLANEVCKLKKNFFFIRTKLSIDVENDKHDHPLTCKDITVNKIRSKMTSHVEKGGFQGVNVFLIDNHSPLDFDFPALVKTMIESAPKWKQDAMTLSLTNLTEDLINRKKDAMIKRIALVSLSSAVAGGLPIPGLSLVVDSGIIIHECNFYRKQFGLDDNSLRKNATLLGLSREHLITRLNITSHLLGSTARSVGAYIATLAISEVAERVTSIALPIIGGIIAATLSYGSTVAVLTSILKEVFVKDALKVNQLLMERLSSSTLS